MASLPKCIYKTIVLSAGETFVLPPGAEVVSVSNSSAISSSCPGDLPEVAIKCYRIRWVVNKDPEGRITYISPFLGPQGISIPNTNNAWEDDDDDSLPIIINKVYVGGQLVDAGSINCRDLASLESVIHGSSGGGAITERKYLTGTQLGALTGAETASWGSRWKSGYVWFEIYFKAPEEIGKQVYLELGGGNGNIADIPRLFAAEIDCTAYPTTTVVTSC